MGKPESWFGVWGILVHPSSPYFSLSSANLLYREDILRSVWSRRGRFQAGRSALGWSLRGVSVWKLNKTYSGEKPPSFSLLTHRCSLVMCKPSRNLLLIHNISVGWEPITRSDDLFSPPAQGLQRHLFKKIKFKDNK